MVQITNIDVRADLQIWWTCSFLGKIWLCHSDFCCGNSIWVNSVIAVCKVINASCVYILYTKPRFTKINQNQDYKIYFTLCVYFNYNKKWATSYTQLCHLLFICLYGIINLFLAGFNSCSYVSLALIHFKKIVLKVLWRKSNN